MNLAQLIDPERAQAEDPLARRPAPLPPMGVVTHDSNITRTDAPRMEASPPLQKRAGANLSQEMRCAIAAAPGPSVPLKYIHAALTDYDVNVVNGTISTLMSHGDMTRSGPRGASQYALTEKGRAKVKKNNGGGDGAGAHG